ncbi:MAG TPA: RusA family crossover junction endodeoxyribonuclease [Candidatus Dormibacteraeota bacterium]|nr:RusA family crossover junction endodeoxyribonuclease [Candidatus Dormibacteraeota bacterium]
MIRFFVQGIPKAMSVGTAFRFKKDGIERHIQGRRNTEWATLVGHIGRQHAPPMPLDGALVFMATFWVPKPASLPKREAATAMPIKRPDLDNLLHKLCDSFNGVFWHDDSQITDTLARKRYPADGRTGVEITVAPITNVQMSARLEQFELDVHGHKWREVIPDMGKSIITFETYGDAGAVTELVGREAIAVLRKGTSVSSATVVHHPGQDDERTVDLLAEPVDAAAAHPPDRGEGAQTE